MNSRALKTQQPNNDTQVNAVKKAPDAEKPKVENSIPFRLSPFAGSPPSDIPLTPQNIGYLHRKIGNKAVGQLIQAKLTIGKPNDKYEQEADRVADQVMQMPEPVHSPKGKNGALQAQAEEQEMLQAQPLEAQITPLVQREMEEEETVQRQAEAKAKAEDEEETTVQRQPEAEEEEAVQMKAEVEEEETAQMKAGIQRDKVEEEEAVQRQAEAKEEEPVQMQPVIQREETEEEEPVQMQAEAKEEEPLQAQPVQRQSEEDEELRAKPIVQRQIAEEEETPVQAKHLMIQRLCPECEKERSEKEGSVQRAINKTPAITIQRLCPKCREKQRSKPGGRSLQLKPANGHASQASPNIESNINAMKGSGNPLPKPTRSFFESRFGADFSAVRIYSDSRAAVTSKSINARAFTIGNNIAFGPGQYSPDTQTGKTLLAHELTHVVQQGDQKPSTTASNIQRNIFGDLWEGVTGLGSRVVSGIAELGSQALEGLRLLGPRALEVIRQLGEAALEWAPRIASILTNPVGALTGGLWLSLPDRFKPPLINTILNFGEAILDRLRGIVSAVIGPLWPLIREFMLGFIRKMSSVTDAMKIQMSNRLARLMTGGSITFILHFFKGLALGIWDVIWMPYDLIVGIIEGVKIIARFISQLSQDDFEEGIQLISGSLSSAWSGIRGMITDPTKAIRFIQTIWDSIQSAIRQMGRGLAEAILRFFQLPDAQMGEETGRFAGGFAIDAIIAIFTAGGGALLRRAAAAAAQVMAWFRRGGRALRMIMRTFRSVIDPLLEGIRKVARLFREGSFGEWLSRFGAWLNRLLIALMAAMGVTALHELGAEDEETHATGEVGEEDEEFELFIEGVAIEIESPNETSETNSISIQRQPGGAGHSSWASPVLSGDPFELRVQRMLREGRIPGMPEMEFVIRGQFSPSGHGQDLFAGRFVDTPTGTQLHIYRVEAKGGRYPRLGFPSAGPQTGRGWTRYAIEGALENPRVLALLRDRTGITDERLLRQRLVAGRSSIIVSRHIRPSALRRLRRDIRRIPRRFRPRIRFIR